MQRLTPGKNKPNHATTSTADIISVIVSKLSKIGIARDNNVTHIFIQIGDNARWELLLQLRELSRILAEFQDIMNASNCEIPYFRTIRTPSIATSTRPAALLYPGRISSLSLIFCAVIAADIGGGASIGGGYTLTGTIGQPEAGELSGRSYTLSGGFWGGAVLPLRQKLFLPLIVR